MQELKALGAIAGHNAALMLGDVAAVMVVAYGTLLVQVPKVETEVAVCPSGLQVSRVPLAMPVRRLVAGDAAKGMIPDADVFIHGILCLALKVAGFKAGQLFLVGLAVLDGLAPCLGFALGL